jgi:16S rRNA (adenine1518-N6/adenine1519-N6)-dimethyltransferase
MSTKPKKDSSQPRARETLHGHQPRKRFGQNFLHDQSVIDAIVNAIAPHTGQNIVEIGPGQGAMTLPVLSRCGAMRAIELDRDLIPHLRKAAAPVGELELISADVLQVNFSALAAVEHARSTDHRLRVIGNLPYNISSPLLFHLMDHLSAISDMHFMLQKEVVLRMAAAPDSPDYGRLSVMLQARCQITHLFDVQPESFFPAPKVTSAIVRLVPHSNQLSAATLQALESLVKMAFSARRKTLSNTLKGRLSADQIRAAGIDPGARAETLSLAEFLALLAQ